MDERTIKLMKFYTPEGGYPRLPIKSDALLALYYKEIEAGANTGDMHRIYSAKYILYYCLN